MIRPAEAADMPYILDSWLKSWRSSPWAGVVPNNRYQEVQRELIEGLVMRGAKFTVDGDGPGKNIYQWVCWEVEKTGKTVVHYYHWREPYGAPDILKCVDGEQPGFYTHKTKNISAILGRGWTHAPEIARRK